MLSIFAQSFMTAARTDTNPRTEAPVAKTHPKGRWLPWGHWFLNPRTCVDMNDY